MIIEVINLKINNLNSINNSLKSISSNAFAVIEKYEDTLNPSLMVLPGLGNFKAGMKSLRKSRLDRFIHEKLDNGSFLLGICLGMQLLGDKSEEAPGVNGLGIIKGQSIKLPSEPEERIPNVGWAAINSKEVYPLTRSLDSNKDFYFTHSYHFRPDENDSVLAETPYGSQLIVSAIKNDRTIGVQFHPEKSAAIGREFLADVIKWAENET
jgi:glutamine amidotransferase